MDALSSEILAPDRWIPSILLSLPMFFVHFSPCSFSQTESWFYFPSTHNLCKHGPCHWCLANNEIRNSFDLDSG